MTAQFGQPYERTLEAENERLLRELSTLRGAAEEMEYNLKNITALLKAYHKLIPDQRALMEIAEAESALARYQATKKG